MTDEAEKKKAEERGKEVINRMKEEGEQGSLRERVEEALNRVRPFIQMDGGDIELVNVNEEDGVVFVRFEGACAGCPARAATLQFGVEAEIRKTVPEVKEVIPVQ